jgi:hypothetical protein
LAIYALGMTVPLFVLALAWDRMRIAERGWLRLGVLIVVALIFFVRGRHSADPDQPAGQDAQGQPAGPIDRR